MYQDIQFDVDNYKNKIGLNQLMYNNKVNCCAIPTFLDASLQIKKIIYFHVSSFFCQVDLLAHLWRYPTVSIHGIEGAFSDPGTKTVIPAKVTAKFSIRQVPDMDPAMVKKQVHCCFLVMSELPCSPQSAAA